MIIGLVKNESHYKQALDRIEALLGEPETPEAERELELLGHLVDKYESEKYPIEYPDPIGIKLVFEKHFRRTYLDGACFLGEDGTPVIGLSIRHDRIDAFWFTLLHEIAHLQLHITPEQRLILDEDIQNIVDQQEREASEFAAHTLIPDHIWEEFLSNNRPQKYHVHKLGQRLGLHPAIVAGRIRYAKNNYKLLHNVVESGKIRPFCELQGLFKPVANCA